MRPENMAEEYELWERAERRRRLAAPAQPQPDQLLTPEEAAARLGLTIKQLKRQHHRLGDIVVRISRKNIRYSASAIDAWQKRK